MARQQVLTGDCREVMAKITPCSVDAIVTDPPYELGFMSHDWDASGVAFDQKTWALAYETLAPGGHLLAFGGARTYHRMVCAIEDAGFDVRDSIMWIYSSGMPKSHDVAASIDKLAGHGPRGRAVPVASSVRPDGKRLSAHKVAHYEAKTDDGQAWSGWGTGLKPAFEPIVVARKPFHGTVARNVLAYGTGALNIDGCRVAATDRRLAEKYASIRNTGARDNAVYGNSSKRRSDGHIEPHAGGRWPANVVFTHDPLCRVVGTREAPAYTINRFDDGAKPFGGGAGHDYASLTVPSGTEDVWECVPGCPVALLDAKSGRQKSRPGKQRTGKAGDGWGATSTGSEYDDEGGASRCFNRLAWDPQLDTFVYCPKANTREREAGLDERFTPDASGRRNVHKTVKPVTLMRHLVRMVTPPGGLVFDPFCGSGTTGIACAVEDVWFLGCEMNPTYARIARARIAHFATKAEHAA